MLIRSRLAVLALVTAGLAAAVPALATELRERRAHVVLDVPDRWQTSVEGDYAVAGPEDHSFRLRIMGTGHGADREQDAEGKLGERLHQHLNNITVDEHAKRIDYNNYSGYEIFGHGQEHDGAPAKFFAMVLNDKRDPNKGVIILGTGTPAGFDMHRPGIHEAIRSLRTY